MDSEDRATLTRLIIVLANSLVDTNASVMALKVMQKSTLLSVAEADPNELDRRMAETEATCRVIAADHLRRQFEEDPQLAWLAAEFPSEAVN